MHLLELESGLRDTADQSARNTGSRVSSHDQQVGLLPIQFFLDQHRGVAVPDGHDGAVRAEAETVNQPGHRLFGMVTHGACELGSLRAAERQAERRDVVLERPLVGMQQVKDRLREERCRGADRCRRRLREIDRYEYSFVGQLVGFDDNEDGPVNLPQQTLDRRPPEHVGDRPAPVAADDHQIDGARLRLRGDFRGRVSGDDLDATGGRLLDEQLASLARQMALGVRSIDFDDLRRQDVIDDVKDGQVAVTVGRKTGGLRQGIGGPCR